MARNRARWVLWGLGGLAGLGALALLTVVAVYFSSVFVIRYAAVGLPVHATHSARP